jgi:hypothetical protein
MTTTNPSVEVTGSYAPAGADASVDLEEFVSTKCFPTTRDSLLAALIGRHAPTPLLWQVARLSPYRTYADLQDVRDALTSDLSALPLEPM